MNFFEELSNFDSEVATACDKELARQRHNIELIASENIVSKAVLLAAGGVLTNKYAEGYPSKRYYGGCQCVDIVEEIARERAKKLFGAEHANVQPHCGASANLAVFFATKQYCIKIVLLFEHIKITERNRFYNSNTAVKITFFIQYIYHIVNKCSKEITLTKLHNLYGIFFFYCFILNIHISTYILKYLSALL